jgi:hypothetical protein
MVTLHITDVDPGEFDLYHLGKRLLIKQKLITLREFLTSNGELML